MKRLLQAIAAILLLSLPNLAQDIPLSKILIEDENWKVAAKDLPC